MQASVEKTVINVIWNYIIDLFEIFRLSKDSMAESLENLVSIDHEWSEGLMHEASKYIAEIVEKTLHGYPPTAAATE